jgi:hypothetical protein
MCAGARPLSSCAPRPGRCWPHIAHLAPPPPCPPCYHMAPPAPPPLPHPTAPPLKGYRPHHHLLSAPSLFLLRPHCEHPRSVPSCVCPPLAPEHIIETFRVKRPMLLTDPHGEPPFQLAFIVLDPCLTLCEGLWFSRANCCSLPLTGASPITRAVAALLCLRPTIDRCVR